MTTLRPAASSTSAAVEPTTATPSMHRLLSHRAASHRLHTLTHHLQYRLLPTTVPLAATSAVSSSSSSSPTKPASTATMSTSASSSSAAVHPASASTYTPTHPPDGVKPSLKHSPNRSAIVFTGSGSSMGLPRAGCIIQQPHTFECVTCPHAAKIAEEHGVEAARDWRGNPSLLIRYHNPQAAAQLKPKPVPPPSSAADKRRTPPPSPIEHHQPQHVNILIDCTKTFREVCLRWLPRIDPLMSHLDAIMLTHSHSDACLGLDDVRTLQPFGAVALPLYGSDFTLDDIKRRFPYLDSVARELELKKGGEFRKVSDIEFKPYQYYESFAIHGLNIIPISVKHGRDYDCSAFIIGNKQKVAYVSDVSEITPEAMAELEKLQTLDVLVIDSLLRFRTHNTHINMATALDYVKQLKPTITYLTGVSDDFLHARDSEWLANWSKQNGHEVRIAYDGLLVELDL